MKLVYLLFLSVSSFITIPIHRKIKPPSINLLPESQILSSVPTYSVANYYNFQYAAIFSVGTPAQDFKMVLDTGSSWIWVPSVGCDCHPADSHFNSSDSSTFISSTTVIELNYGQGYVSGTYSKDVVAAGSLSVKNQAFVLSTEDSDLGDLKADGLLGLAFNGLSGGNPTFIENLKLQGEIDHEIFSLYLSNFNDYNTQSEFTIGGYDEKKYSIGGQKVIDINPLSPYWTCTLNEARFDGQVVGNEALAILDIGTSALFGPSDAVDSILGTLSKGRDCWYDGFLICYCAQSDIQYFPNIILTLGDNEYTITPENYVYYDSVQACYFMIVDSGDDYWLIGQALFREYYSVYDMENYQVFMYSATRYEKGGTTGILSYLIMAGIGAAVAGILIYFHVVKSDSTTPVVNPRRNLRK